MRKILFGAVFTALAFTGSAHAQGVGAVTAITGEAGQVVVQRGTEIINLSEGDEIFEGDKVTTRAGGTVEITTRGCTVALPAVSTITVGPDFCTVPPTSLASTTPPPGTPAPNPVVTAGGGVSTTTALLITGGVLAAGTAIAAATDEDEPASP